MTSLAEVRKYSLPAAIGQQFRTGGGPPFLYSRKIGIDRRLSSAYVLASDKGKPPVDSPTLDDSMSQAGVNSGAGTNDGHLIPALEALASGW
jgi:hypothetical protein